MSKKSIVIAMVAIIAIIIILLSILMFNLNKRAGVEVEENSNVVRTTQVIEDVSQTNSLKTSSETVKISPNASILFLKSYEDCGHTTKTKETVSSEMVNLTEDELKNLYSDWQVNKFSSTEIELIKNFPGSCDEHYCVKATDGYVCIYHIQSDGTLKLYETTQISIKYLPEADVSELEQGVVLYGKENLNSYIENFE